jgi:hypothetical protein
MKNDWDEIDNPLVEAQTGALVNAMGTIVKVGLVIGGLLLIL